MRKRQDLTDNPGMAYSPRVIANALLRTAKEHGETVSHLKLQKLVFYVHAWMLAIHDRPALSEPVEAWQYGPVVSSLYHELKGYGSDPISDYLKEPDHSTGKLVALVPHPNDKRIWSIIGQVWDKYGRYSAAKLSAMTHQPGSPWASARTANVLPIPDESIQAHFKERLSKANVNERHDS